MKTLRTTLNNRILGFGASAIALVALSSCTYTQRGAVVGGLGGATVGALVADDAGKGALVGGAIGAAGGAAIGYGRDRRHDYPYDYHYGAAGYPYRFNRYYHGGYDRHKDRRYDRYDRYYDRYDPGWYNWRWNRTW